MNPSVLVISAASVAPIMSMFLPPWYEVRQGGHNPAELRFAAMVAASVVVGIGVAASTVTRSPAPLWGAIIGAVIVSCGYEWAVRNPAGG